jgi:hypothetical protein
MCVVAGRGPLPFPHESRQLVIQAQAEILVRFGTEIEARQAVRDATKPGSLSPS